MHPLIGKGSYDGNELKKIEKGNGNEAAVVNAQILWICLGLGCKL